MNTKTWRYTQCHKHKYLMQKTSKKSDRVQWTRLESLNKKQMHPGVHSCITESERNSQYDIRCQMMAKQVRNAAHLGLPVRRSLNLCSISMKRRVSVGLQPCNYSVQKKLILIVPCISISCVQSSDYCTKREKYHIVSNMYESMDEYIFNFKWNTIFLQSRLFTDKIKMQSIAL